MQSVVPADLLDIEEPECVNAPWPAALQAEWDALEPGIYECDLATGRPVQLEAGPVTAPKIANALAKSPVVGTIGPKYPEDALDCTDWHDGDWTAFQRLFLGGEPGKQTGSEDDFQLACLIVKAKVREPAEIESIMRAAEIARTGPREKWDRNRGYLPRTIARALQRGPAKPANAFASSAPKEAEGPLEVSIAELAKNPDLLTVPADVSPWLVKRGLLSMLVGREKLAGKSTLGASDASAAAQRGHLVLWVDVEQGHHRVVKRFVDLQASLGKITTLRRWPQSWDEVEAVISRVRPDAIYVDSVSSFLMAVEGGVPDASEGERWQALVGRFKRWTQLGKPQKLP